MYICTHVRIYVCMYVCIGCIYVCCISVYLGRYTPMHTQITHQNRYVCTCVNMFLCVYDVCVQVLTYTYIHMHIYIYICDIYIYIDKQRPKYIVFRTSLSLSSLSLPLQLCSLSQPLSEDPKVSGVAADAVGGINLVSLCPFRSARNIWKLTGSL